MTGPAPKPYRPNTQAELGLDLFPETSHATDAVPVLDLFAGPGGWDQGARDAGLPLAITGIEIDPWACATARAAGHKRVQADAMGLDLTEWHHARGLIASPPCPTFSAAGLRAGVSDIDALHDAVTMIGETEPDENGHPARWTTESWAEVCENLKVTDPRNGFFAVAFWAATRLPNLDWVVLEQVPAATPLFEDIATELEAVGWHAIVHEIDAADLGLPVRRRRCYLTAARRPHVIDWTPEPPQTMAGALGWPAGHRIRTRNNRTGGGGNLFSADGPSWALTGSARTWEREEDGYQITAAEAGRLHGFAPDYPWQGTRTRQFQQIADVVLPPIAGRILTALHHTTTPPAPGGFSS